MSTLAPSLTVAIVGPPAAGKTTAAHFLVQALQFSFEQAPRRVIDGVASMNQLMQLRSEFGEALHVLGVEAPLGNRRGRWEIRAEGKRAAHAWIDRTFEQAEATWDPRLLEQAEAVVRNLDPWLLTAQVVAIVQQWLHVRPRTLFAEMLEAVEIFHRKNGFPIGDGDRETLYRHQALLTEELGEISAAITKGKGDLTEEHADVLVLVLGTAVAMGWNLEEVFWRKIDKIMRREGRVIDGETRVSAWGAEEQGTLRELARLRSLRRILHPELGDQLDLDDAEGQTEMDLGM